jgi:hypothetical protein
MKHLKLFEDFYYSDEKDGIITENISDDELTKKIDNLTSKDLHWSEDPENGLNFYFNFDDVDEELLLTQLLNLIKKINPNADLEKKKLSFNKDFSQFNDKLNSASQKSFSAESGLKNYFKDNLYIFK